MYYHDKLGGLWVGVKINSKRTVASSRADDDVDDLHDVMTLLEIKSLRDAVGILSHVPDVKLI